MRFLLTLFLQELARPRTTVHDVRTQCSVCGTWYWAGDAHTCPTVLMLPSAGLTPTDLPDGDRPGTTVRYAIDEHLTPCLRAVLNHPAETVIRRPRFAKEYVL